MQNILEVYEGDLRYCIFKESANESFFIHRYKIFEWKKSPEPLNLIEGRIHVYVLKKVSGDIIEFSPLEALEQYKFNTETL